MHRIRRRDLFSFVGEVLLSPSQRRLVQNKGKQAKEGGLLAIISSSSCAIDEEPEKRIASEDVLCQVVKMGYGKGGKTPVLVILRVQLPLNMHTTSIILITVIL
jgi:hypothetical protein